MMSRAFRSWRPRGAASVVPALALTLFLLPSALATPFVQEGECLWLVGAPPGEPEASTARQSFGSKRHEYCDNPDVGTWVDAGDNRVQLWATDEGEVLLAKYRGCGLEAWLGHDFTVELLGGSAAGWVDVAGFWRGELGEGQGVAFPSFITGLEASLRIAIDVVERPTPGAEETLVAGTTVFQTTVRTRKLFPEDSFSVRVPVRFVAGREYSARLHVEVEKEGISPRIDFGRPPGIEDRHVRYDSIRVCIDRSPEHDLHARLDDVESELTDLRSDVTDLRSDMGDLRSDMGDLRSDMGDLRSDVDGVRSDVTDLRGDVALILARLDSDTLDRIEWELLNKDCRPGLWLPAARGGRLEDVFALVATRIAAADGDRGANASLARARLSQAEALAADGWHQKACQRASDALRALTTP